MTFYITLFLALMQNASASNWVVLDVETGKNGNAQSIEILQGVNPFLDLALANVRQWTLAPGGAPRPAESHVTAVFLFRPRELFSSSPVQSSQAFRRSSDHPPLPMELLDPGYPVTSVGEGAAVLELQIDPMGGIEHVQVVGDVPGLAAYTEKALRTWKFQPAMRNGTAVTGTVIVVASYLRPTIYNNPPSTGGTDFPYVPNENSGSPAPLPPTFREGRPAPPRF